MNRSQEMKELLPPEQAYLNNGRDIVQILSWDTEFFGFPVAQVSGNRLDEESMEIVQAFCARNRIRLLQFKCDAHHRPSVLLAERHGFHMADVRMIYSRPIYKKVASESLPVGVTFRLGTMEDVKPLKDIATDLYTQSRYYFDENFPRDRVKIFYQDWIEKAVRGTFDDLAWVICQEEILVGFCSVHFIGKDRAGIGLIGIDQNMNGRGMGCLMMQHALRAMAKRGIKKVSVVTQGRNYSAQRLYQKAGFLVDHIEIYYHCWFD